MRKYLYTLAILALFIVVPAQAQQTITKPVIITMEAETFDLFKLYIATLDEDEDTVLETDISRAAALTWIQGRMSALLQQLQGNALNHARQTGRTDLIPTPITDGEVILESARVAKLALETEGLAVLKAAAVAQHALENGNTGVN